MPSDDEKSKKPSPEPTPRGDDSPAEQDDESEEDQDMAGDDDSESSEEDEEMNITASDEEDQGEGALDNLQNFVSNLDTTASQKRKAADDADEIPRERKRRIIREKTETGAEDEFRIDSSGMYCVYMKLFRLMSHQDPN